MLPPSPPTVRRDSDTGLPPCHRHTLPGTTVSTVPGRTGGSSCAAMFALPTSALPPPLICLPLSRKTLAAVPETSWTKG